LTKFLLKITEKWPAKVLSVAAAIIIAVFYRMNTLETRSFTVPLRVQSNGDLVPASSFANTVKVSLRGEASDIHPIPEEDIEAYIDLGKYTNAGSYQIPVQVRKKGNALGIEPLEISVLPVDIFVQLDQKESRNIPVFPVFSGTIADGYELTDQSFNSDSVIAEGPRSVLDTQYEFKTETIDLDRRFESFSVRVKIINDNPLITIHGNQIAEYRGTIRRIMRGLQEDKEEE